ncbi:MAG: PGF-pre-PGF domain-containing protein [Methanoregula sp.]
MAREIMKKKLLFFTGLVLFCMATTPVLAVTGADWSAGTLNAAFTSRSGQTSVSFNDRLWIIGGTDGATIRNDTWSSADGILWTRVNATPAFPARSNAASLVFNNRVWIIGGTSAAGSLNDTWSSADGSIWTLANASAQFPARSYHSAAVFNNRMWVIGGYTSDLTNDTWSSADGEIWIPVNNSAEFPARDRHTAVVFDNRLWVIGGLGAVYLNDTWYSNDGGVWLLMNSSCAFPIRNNHATAVFNGTLWLTGGDNGVTWMNDTWHSGDGNVWTVANVSAAFPARGGHSMVVSGSRMWISGGTDSAGGYFNDTWYTPGPPVPAPAPTVPAAADGSSGQSPIQSSIRQVQGLGNPVTFIFGNALSPTNPVRVESVTVIPSSTFSGELLCIVKDASLQNHPLPPGQELAGLAEIDLDWTRADTIRQGTIVFSLDRQWMNDRHVLPADIVLLHNTGGSWQELQTSFDRETSGRCYFNAKAPGFSVFAVAARKPVQAVTMVTVSPSTTITGTSVVSVTPDTISPGSLLQEPMSPNLTPAGAPGKNGSSLQENFPLIPALVVAFGIVLVTAAALVRRWWIRRQNPALFRKYR